jgi:hypothetical protein
VHDVAVSNDAVLKKMLNEIQEALNKERAGSKSVRENIVGIRLLCDLVLEEEKGLSEKSNDKELLAMMGDVEARLDKPNTEAGKNGESSKVNLEEANGDSIFDF